MIHELKPPETRRVAALFAPFGFHASCAAVLNGASPGRVLVDDPRNPAAGFVFSPEAAYLSGDAGNRGFCSELEAFLRDPANLGMPMWHLVFIVSSEGWVKRLEEMAGESGVARYDRRHYVCEKGHGLPALSAPPGAVLRWIDEAFLADEGIAKPRHMERWIRNNWGSEATFLTAGFGVATVCGSDVVSWSVADCANAGVCEIGIHTAPDWRRKGMGSFTANAAVRRAFAVGLHTVGWHCHEENVASWRTAERAGFALERKYEEYGIREPAPKANAGDAQP